MNLTLQNSNQMRTIIIFLIVWIPAFCFAQQNYVEFDTIIYAGTKVIDQGKRQNALSCQWQKSKNEVLNLTPYEARSYAIGGVVYVARDVEINGKEGRFFLEKMASGNLTLFFIKNEGKHFFVEKDDDFFELTKRDASGKKHYKKTLQALGADCDYTGSFLKRTWYNRYYLERFVNRYNVCEEVYRPVRFGVVGGLDYTGYSMFKDVWKVSDIPFENSFTFGAFADIPVLQSRISFHPEFLYTKQAYRVSEASDDKHEKEAIANIEMYSVPLLIRYTWWTEKCSPFLNLGAVWHHYSRLENSVLTANFSSGVLDIQQTEPELLPSKYAVTGGVGVWYKISRRNTVFVEARAAYNSNKMTYNVFTGINF